MKRGRLYASLILLLLTTTKTAVLVSDFQIDDIRIGDPCVHYLDPEFIDVNASDPFATRIATIRVPPGDQHRYIRSIEILQTNLDRYDQTYFAFLGATISEPVTPCDGSMWIANLGANPAGRFVRRVDEGAIKTAAAIHAERQGMVALQ